jgi:hypothetical protein
MRMSRLDRIVALAGQESGAVLVIFAVFAPVAILLAGFAIDTGNWWLQKRHLQVQADAAALATAQGFQPCANESIYRAAAQFGGVASVTTPEGVKSWPFEQKKEGPYNVQAGGAVHELINSQTFYEQSAPVDSSASTAPPCTGEMVDVKLTETGQPWWQRALSHVASFNVNAHARVEIRQAKVAKGLEPLAVAETAPVAAAAYFINEDNGATLVKVPLIKLGTNNAGQDVWGSNAAAVTINHPHIGVVIALSGSASDTKCGDPYVKCFDQGSTGPSLLHIQGWSSAGSGTGSYKAPIERQVTLQSGSCTDGYFAPSGKGCSIGVTAKVDLGPTPKPAGVKVSAIVGGGTPVAMTYNAITNAWNASSVVVPKEGSNRVDLRVTCEPKATNSVCAAEKGTPTKTLEDVQRAYAAGEGSGPIAAAWVYEPGAAEPVPGSLDAESYESCAGCTHKLAVTVNVAGSIENAASFSDPFRNLRFEGEQGVRAGCPPTEGPSGKRYEEHLGEGCPGAYTINTADPQCTVNTSPYECLVIGLTGKDTGPTKHGIDARLVEHPPVGTRFYCANSWQNNNGGGVPIIPQDDSRLIQVFIIPYGTVDSEGRSLLGNEEVPIQDFAVFYVTGFPGDPCKSDPNTGNAEVVGHFVKYVNTSGGDEGGEKCVANSLGECVAVLTR